MKKNMQLALILVTLLVVKEAVGQYNTNIIMTGNSKLNSNTPLGLHFVIDSTDEFISSNLPIIIIDTHGQTIPVGEPRVNVDMRIVYNGDSVRNYITGPYNNYDGKISIEKRGWSSRKFPKKQYAFETQDESGENLNVSLLGLPAENDWILHAPYSDKTLMRNVLTYKLFSDLGRYASRTRFCELIMDDEYKGVYVLMEKIKRDKNRVDISKLEPDEISGDDFTGGYIIKIDKFTNSDSVWASSYPPHLPEYERIQYQYRYPLSSEIVDQQKKYIQDYIYKFESVMYDSNYSDPLIGYSNYIDINSYVDFFIINELTKNVDGYRLSTFMYKDRDSKGGKLTMGPIWDFNIGFGNANYRGGQKTDSWIVNILSLYGHGKYEIPFWWKKLIQDANFANRINVRWYELRNNIFNVDSIFNYIDSVAIYLDESQERNFKKWPILGTRVWPNYFVGETYQEEVDYLKQWLNNRIQWMDENMLGNYAAVTWANPDSVNLTGIVGFEKTIPITKIVIDSVNIDSIIFESRNLNLQITQEIDTLRLIAITNSVFEFISTAYSRGDTASISPIYNFTSITTDLAKISEIMPAKFSLDQNYPNPFNITTSIKYELPKATNVNIKIYNMFSQEVKTLVNSYQTAGYKSVIWDGKDNLDQIVSSGIYIYSLQVGNKVQRQKMLLLK